VWWQLGFELVTITKKKDCLFWWLWLTLFAQQIFSLNKKMLKAKAVFRSQQLQAIRTSQRHYAQVSSNNSNVIIKPIVCDRDDPNFAWLKTTAGIEAHTNKIVKLPVLPCAHPKGFDDDTADKFFLTEQRASVLLRVKAESNKISSKDDKGLVTSGPHGIGKTSFTYLIAAYAWVNRYPLVYIVRFAVFILII